MGAAKISHNRVARLKLAFAKALIISQLIVVVSAQAQEQESSPIDLSNYRISSWGANEGLPNTLGTLYQDSDQYLWIGSYEGLFRYDGNKFESYNRFNTPGLIDNRINSILGDPDGNLWVGTGKGLSVRKDGKFINVAGKQDFYIEKLCLNKTKDKLWIGTRNSGLFEYDIRNDRYRKVESLGRDLISALVQDTSGGIWIGSEVKGLAYLKDSILKYYGPSDGLLNTEVLFLFLSPANELYISTTQGLFKKHGDRFTEYKELQGERVNAVNMDLKGNLVVATQLGLRRQGKDGRWNHITKQHGISNNVVTDICFGKEGSIWVSTYRGGLNQLCESDFSTVSAIDGLDVEAVGAIYELSENLLLLGTTDGKLFTIDNGLVKPFLTKTKLTQRIYSILLDDKKNLWIVSPDGLLVITHDGEEKLFIEKDGLPTRQVRTILQDRNGNYWIGSRNNGLIKMTIDQSALNPVFERFKYEELNEVQSTFIMSVEADDNGNLLIGTNTGGLVIVSEDGKIQHYGKEEGLSKILIFNILIDKEGPVWLVTDQGVTIMENGRFFDFTPQHGLPDVGIFDIVEDSQGYFWMPTVKGLVRVQKQQLLDFRNGKISAINWKIYSHNELNNYQCTATARILKASDGALWFPMHGGVVSVQPETITTNKKIPTVYIEKVLVDATEYIAKKEIVLSGGSQRVVFNYTALSLLYPNTAKYKYKLEPFDRDWVDAGDEQHAIYTNIPSGEFTFRVIACNNDGVWNETGASIVIIKHPYFYQTWWFNLVVLAAFVLSTTMYIRWRTREAKRRASVLEIEVDKRTLQLKQKSEALEEQIREKTGMIDIVAHDLKAPLNKIKGLMNLIAMTGEFSDDQQEYLDYIEKSIQDGNHLIRDLLDIHSLEHEDSKLEINEIDIIQVLEEWQYTMGGMLNQKNQLLQSQLKIDTPIMATDKHKLIRILDNLLTNASKFSENGKEIYFNVWQEGDLIHFSIKDQGPGISEEDKRKLFKRFQKLTAKPTGGENSSGLGLSIIQVLVSKLKGSIAVHSTLGEGAEFVVSLPTQPVGDVK